MARSNPSMEPRDGKMTVTPEMAEKWLGRNTHNRTLRNRHVENLTNAIKKGEWKYNGDAIRFAKDGTLIDGQHRLWACVMADKSIETMVLTGLDMTAQLTIDAGAKRRLADELKLRGFKSASTLASIINFKWKLDNGTVREAANPSIVEALGVLDSNPDLPDASRMASRFHSRLVGSVAVVGAVYHEMANRDADAADEFMERLIEGTDLKNGSPILALRRQIETTKLSSIMFAALMIKAWNAYVEGREVSQLHWRPVGRQPEAFPEVKG